MTSISASIHVWVKTVLINVFFMIAGAAIAGEAYVVVWAIVYLFVGIIATLPLLLFITPLMNLSRMLTKYGVAARMAWLAFCLMILVFLFYLLLSMATTVSLFDENSELAKEMPVTMASVVVSVFINRRALKELYEDKQSNSLTA